MWTLQSDTPGDVAARSAGAHRTPRTINAIQSNRVTNMKTVTSKLLPLAAAAMLAGLCGPVSAEYNSNVTIQEGRVNTNDTLQRGRYNENATLQLGRDNANRTRQRGRENFNGTGQFGRKNYNKTSQSGRYQRTGNDHRRGRD